MAKNVRVLGGAAPYLKKYRINATIATAGVPCILGATGTAGIGPQLVRGTALLRTPGLTLDTGTYTTTQSTTMIEGVVTIASNPDMVTAWLLSGSTAGTSGVALTTTTNTAASSGGTAITITTGDPVPNSPTMLDGTVLCLTGANTGLERQITTVSATVITVVVPFPNAIAVGDIFVAIPYSPKGMSATASVLSGSATMTVDTTGLDATIATTTNSGNLRWVDLLYDYAGPSNGRANAQLLTMFMDHLFAPGVSVT